MRLFLPNGGESVQTSGVSDTTLSKEMFVKSDDERNELKDPHKRLPLDAHKLILCTQHKREPVLVLILANNTGMQ